MLQWAQLLYVEPPKIHILPSLAIAAECRLRFEGALPLTDGDTQVGVSAWQVQNKRPELGRPGRHDVLLLTCCNKCCASGLL